MSFSAYDEYKDSGVELLGEVPSHWDVPKLQSIAVKEPHSFSDGPFGSDLKNEEYTESGVPLIQLNNISSGQHVLNNIKYISDEKADQLAKHNAFPGDIVLAKMAEPVARAAAVQDAFDRFVVVADCIRLAVDQSVADVVFAVYAINACYFRSQAESRSSGITRLRINLGVLKQLRLAVPPLPEQTAIASFLDTETSKIDSLVSEQRRLIELLKEKRQAVISHAVTKGLDPSVPMKESGIEWLGEVPEHWSVSSLRHFATFYTGSTPARDNLTYWNGDIPWVKTGEINYKLITETEETITQEGLDQSSCSIAPAGTMLMALYGQGVTRGRVAVLGIPAAFNQACVAITVDDRISNDFLHTFFIFAYPHIRDVGNETTQMNMNVEFVRRIQVVVPLRDEQKEIADYVNKRVETFLQLQREAERAIELLQERRTALISAAVTGKIDVREFAYQETA